MMMDDKYEQWLVGWFSKKSQLPEDFGSKNYFEENWIDSLGVMFLIGDIESEFSCQFSHDAFQDRRFSTITGLAEMISELKSGTLD